MTSDFIIVGAGSAGCVLANRLSEDPGNQVLLLEAGGSDSKLEIHIPGGYMKLHQSNVDWNCYWTEPQPELKNRKIYHPRGKVLGGSSSTNAMAYIRGQHQDYDHWEKLGNPGWSYADVLPYFRKSENNEQFESKFHGRGGPLNVTVAQRYKTPMATAFIKACYDTGIPENNDFNGERQEGAGMFQYTIRNAKRWSTARAFLYPVMNRPNLKIMTGVLTRRILIEKDEASGVEFVRGKTVTHAFARKSVILAAGAFASPHLLLRSGIGPAEQLRRAGIPVRKDLTGVGQNLQDHLMYPVSSLCNQPISNNHYLAWHQQAAALAKYFLFKNGPLTIGPLEANAFVKSDRAMERPDIQFQFTPTHGGDDYNASMYDLKSLPHTDGYTILPTQVRPYSRGEVRLNPADPFGLPIIDPSYLSADEDKVLMVRAGRMAFDILEGAAFSTLRIRTHCPRHHDSDEAWLDHIRRSAECVYHPVGTCKMGTDSMAVVDPQLKVHGIDRLRVVDASIMPVITSGNTNAPVIMIAEKGSDLIVQSRNP